MAGHLLAEPSFDPEIGLEEPALGGLVVLDLGDAVRHPAGVAEEELEQELAAEGLVPRRDGEPARELSTPLLGERIDVTIGLAALLFAPPRGEALGGQPIQDRVDLPVALVPEVGDRALDQLLDVVARHRAEAQHPRIAKRLVLSRADPVTAPTGVRRRGSWGPPCTGPIYICEIYTAERPRVNGAVGRRG